MILRLTVIEWPYKSCLFYFILFYFILFFRLDINLGAGIIFIV